MYQISMDRLKELIYLAKMSISECAEIIDLARNMGCVNSEKFLAAANQQFDDFEVVFTGLLFDNITKRFYLFSVGENWWEPKEN